MKMYGVARTYRCNKKVISQTIPSVNRGDFPKVNTPTKSNVHLLLEVWSKYHSRTSELEKEMRN